MQLSGAYRGQMTDEVRQALASDPTIDITTTGRNSGEPRRIEIWMLAVEDRFFITGTPGPRGWLANIRTNPRVVVHMKNGMHADLVLLDEALQVRATWIGGEAAWPEAGA